MNNALVLSAKLGSGLAISEGNPVSGGNPAKLGASHATLWPGDFNHRVSVEDAAKVFNANEHLLEDVDSDFHACYAAGKGKNKTVDGPELIKSKVSFVTGCALCPVMALP